MNRGFADLLLPGLAQFLVRGVVLHTTFDVAAPSPFEWSRPGG